VAQHDDFPHLRAGLQAGALEALAQVGGGAHNDTDSDDEPHLRAGLRAGALEALAQVGDGVHKVS